MEIYPDIQVISGIASRLYLIRDVEGFTMIDAGLRLDAGRIIRFLEKHIQEPGLLTQILITHADGDHFGGVNAIICKYPNVSVRA